jgi:hypothetical protein
VQCVLLIAAGSKVGSSVSSLICFATLTMHDVLHSLCSTSVRFIWYVYVAMPLAVPVLV